MLCMAILVKDEEGGGGQGRRGGGQWGGGNRKGNGAISEADKVGLSSAHRDYRCADWHHHKCAAPLSAKPLATSRPAADGGIQYGIGVLPARYMGVGSRGVMNKLQHEGSRAPWASS